MPRSTCQNPKPYKTMDSSCANYTEVCYKKDDNDCENLQNICAQCPSSTHNILAIISKNKEEAFILLYVIISINILLFLVLLMELRFKLITKCCGCYPTKDLEKHENIFQSRKYIRGQHSKLETKLNEVLEIFEPQLDFRIDSNSNVIDLIETSINVKLNSKLDIIAGMIKKSLDSKVDMKMDNIIVLIEKSLDYSNSKLKFLIPGLEIPIELHVNENDSVIQVKRQICAKWSKAEPHYFKIMKLKYNGRYLDDNQYLLLTIVSINATIICEINHKINYRNIIVLKLQGNKRVPELIQMRKEQTVGEMKNIISKIIYSAEYAIFKEAKELFELKDNVSLDNCNLKDDDWIRVIVKETGKLVIKSIIEEKDPCIIEYSNLERISELKKRATLKFICDPDDFAMFSNNRYLEEDKFVFEYDINNESTLKFCCLTKMDNFNQSDLIDDENSFELFKAKLVTKNEDVIIKKYYKPSKCLSDNQDILNELITFQITKSQLRFVQLIKICKDDKCLYGIFENMEGGSISTFLNKNWPLTELEIAKWSFQILEGLKFLHYNKIIHRNLKASNILVDDQRNVKLLSFALSKYLHGYETRSFEKEFVETPTKPSRYVAPEILNCKQYGVQTDIWSFGAILIEIITGKIPHYGRNDEEAAEILRFSKTIEYDLLTCNISTELQDFIDSCIRPDPKERATIEELFEHNFLKILK